MANLKGMTMNFPLTIRHVLWRNERLWGHKEVVTVVGEKDVSKHRYRYRDFQHRVRRMSNILKQLGVKRGDRVGTFAYNHYQHLELYFAIPCMGAVLHTINIRLFPDQTTYIINHAEDTVLFVDTPLLSQIKPVVPEMKSVRHIIIMGSGADEVPLAEFEKSLLGNRTDIRIHKYEVLLSGCSDTDDSWWPSLDETDAVGLCYTSATTGNPKGVLYSHRAVVMITLLACIVDNLSFGERDVILPLVPMFHANAWNIPYVAVMTGATLVLAGHTTQPATIVSLIQEEKVTVACGVPTIWVGVAQHLKERGGPPLASLKYLLVGGSALPKSMIEEYHRWGIRIQQGWGMTELAPSGTISFTTSEAAQWPLDRQFDQLARQGIPIPFLEIRIVDTATGKEQPWDGTSLGEVQVRGVAVTTGYFKEPNSPLTPDGWLKTGDVGVIDTRGFLQLKDRTKDLIKTGGEWVASVELENHLIGHPSVFEAAVVAVADRRWGERPLAIVALKDAERVRATKNPLEMQEELKAFLRTKVAKWMVPDEVVFVEQIPKTGVGKIDKKLLREMFKHKAKL